MSDVSSIVAGFAFCAVAAANVVVMLEASRPSCNAATKARLIAVHRIGGYLFVILFCIMVCSMSRRLAGSGMLGDLPTHLVLHIVLVLVLVPLLLLKILIARRYKQSRSSLKALGVAIFVISFVLVSIPTFSELLRSLSPGNLGVRIATGLLVAVCLVQCALVLVKKKPLPASVDSSHDLVVSAPAIYRESGSPMTLLLAHTEEQTQDTKTLRFQVLS